MSEGKENFIKLGNWCYDNQMDYVSVLLIAKQGNVVFKIGNDFFITNEEDLNS
jgi:hypothetical protein